MTSQVDPQTAAQGADTAQTVMASEGMEFILNAAFVDKFWEVVKKIDHTEACWQWTGPLHRQGFGRLSVDKKDYGTHRIAYELEYGPIPPDQYVYHRCNNRGCCRPDHLFLQSKGHRKGRKTGQGAYAQLAKEILPSMFHVKHSPVTPGIKVVMGGESLAGEAIGQLKSLATGVHALLRRQGQIAGAVAELVKIATSSAGKLQLTHDFMSGVRLDLQRAVQRLDEVSTKLDDPPAPAAAPAPTPAPAESGPAAVTPTGTAPPEDDLSVALMGLFAELVGIPIPQRAALNAAPMLDAHDAAVRQAKGDGRAALNLLRSWMNAFAIVVRDGNAARTTEAFFAWTCDQAAA